MRDADPDFRIVATDDLMKGLTENTLRVAESDERDLVQAVLRLLADVNGEVQNRAVQWYAFIHHQWDSEGPFYSLRNISERRLQFLTRCHVWVQPVSPDPKGE
jgi:hypothetical protein